MTYRKKLVLRIVAKVACFILAAIVAPIQAYRMTPETNSVGITPMVARTYSTEDVAKANPGVPYIETNGKASVSWSKNDDGNLVFDIKQNGETRYDSVVMHLYSQPVQCMFNDLEQYTYDHVLTSSQKVEAMKRLAGPAKIEYTCCITGAKEGSFMGVTGHDRVAFSGSSFYGMAFSSFSDTYANGSQICFNIAFGRNPTDAGVGTSSGNVGDGKFTFKYIYYNAISTAENTNLTADALQYAQIFGGLFSTAYGHINKDMIKYNSPLYLFVVFYLVVSLLLCLWFIPYTWGALVKATKWNIRTTMSSLANVIICVTQTVDQNGNVLKTESDGGMGFFMEFIIWGAIQAIIILIWQLVVILLSALFFVVSLLSDIIFVIFRGDSGYSFIK